MEEDKNRDGEKEKQREMCWKERNLSAEEKR